MGKMSDLDIDLQDLRAEFIDGPAADQMSFEQFLMRKGRKDLLDLSGGMKPKKFKKGREVGVTDPKVVPPNDPSLKPKTKKKSKPKSGAVDKSLRPKARPSDAVRVGPGGVRPRARPDKESSRSPRQFEPMKPTLENKRGFTPGEQTPPMTRGGEFRPPEILGREMNPRIGVVGMKKGRKVRGAGIASKGVRECKMR